jgi:superfamily II DNA or RNA helicase/5-methylcytosine-specific restriction endonuclease McrA
MTGSDYYREYDLIKARKSPSKITLAPHQRDAQVKLMKWFGKEKNKFNNGGILVLPTGGGKTFTAVRFLCEGALSEGYKVLWLAHTHHLLEQAYYSFGPREIDQQRGFEVGLIREPKEKLNVRVVSSTPDHYRIQHVKPTDDILICTLQTASNGLKRKQPHFMEFLESAGDKLFVVFDEAHHSPAPSYRNFIINLREKFSQMYLLGLTATPTYTDEKKKGWLKDLFPDDLLYQVTLNELMAQEILAKPIFENPNTEFEPDFEDREYEKWVNSFRDLPENIIEQLATSRSRNQFIAKAYAKNRDKYGKTLIFADRWNQCVQLCEFLRKEGVNAGAMFTHVYQSGNGRIIGGGNSNAKTLEKFRNNELDVLVNIRMLTEGTDVPDVDTIFLTRQTTSKILLTQMIGRALRGPKFGGTEEARIVSFVDTWNQKINWAEWDPLSDDGEGESEIKVQKRPPWQLISVDLVRHLSQVMFNNQSREIGPFLKNVPIGWYQTKFYALTKDNDYDETNRLVMVFDNEKEEYEHFMDYLSNIDLSDYQNEEITLDSQVEELNEWSKEYFNPEKSVNDLNNNLFYIASHIGQSEEKPQFFPFEDRKFHDMDDIARQYMNIKLFEVDYKLKVEFERKDRYWRVIYPNFESFRQQFFACVQRLQDLTGDVDTDIINGYEPGNGEIEDYIKKAIKKKYPNCLSCGESNKRLLEVDHINPRYFGGNDNPDNLQTLCRYCNIAKNILEIDFRAKKSPLNHAPKEFKIFNSPRSNELEDKTWIKYIKRLINQFYYSTAVKDVKINKNNWIVELNEGNNPEWIRPHLDELTNEIKIFRNQINLKSPEKIIIL